MEHCIVESTFDSPLSEAEESRTGNRIDSYLAENGGRWLRSYHSKDRRHIVCEFEAPDEDVVREAYAEARCAYDRIFMAVVYEAAESMAR